ncbi:hypothetical protein [uncultured Winogradskyella sp.]|uniref:hypothetical protein n=1 Tax=uncultured Winogradskyella sp. TaxID=395353 RepID=UPI0030DC3692|tara:strand:+ start:139762 stop:140040 length:279 start_codon:yes stop_codon:yes gene_type:complete
MYLQEEIKAITSKLAKLYDSPITIITKESGYSRPTVSKFYNLHPLKPSSIEKLYDVCLELIEKKEKKRNQSLQKEHSLLKGVKPNIQTSLEV